LAFGSAPKKVKDELTAIFRLAIHSFLQITGITCRDGAYLAKFLLNNMTDSGSLTCIVQQVQPDEVYNLATQTFLR
jgi:GDP-D-mannose dehydratase